MRGARLIGGVSLLLVLGLAAAVHSGGIFGAGGGTGGGGGSSTGNPFVIPSTLATGGLIGGIPPTPPNPSGVFGTSNDAIQSMTAPWDGYARNLFLNYTNPQATGAQTLWSLLTDQASGSSSWGPKMVVTSGAPAGVLSAALQYRIFRGSSIVFNSTVGSNTIVGEKPTAWSMEYLLDDGGIMLGGVVYSNPAFGTTSYHMPYGPIGLGASLAQTALVAPFAGTVKRLCQRSQGTQDASGSCTARLVVDGVATNVIATHPAGVVAGTFCDTVNTAPIAANQTVSVEIKNNATGGTACSFITHTFELLPSSGAPGIVGGAIQGAWSAGQTLYYTPFTGISSATEATQRMPMPRAGTMTNFCVQRAVGASVGTTTATIYKNGSSAGQLTMTIGNATGPQCVTGSVAIAQGDTITMQVANTVACTGGCPTFGGWSVDY